MFQKVHICFTLLCTGITAFIMVIMSLGFLYISEKGLYKNQLVSFQSDMNNFMTGLIQQKIISNNWIRHMESSNNYVIYITDNHIPLFYNSLSEASLPDERDILITDALEAYAFSLPDLKAVNFDSFSDIGAKSEFYVYPFKSSQSKLSYYGSVINITDRNTNLQAVIVSSLSLLQNQIKIQRLLFLLINILALLLLTIFSWLFTGKLLKPIEKNQQKQTAFISAASHELRTPLAVILSYTESYQNAPRKKRDSFITIIHSESLRMSGLVNDMLTLSQSDNHCFSIHKTKVELDTLLLNCCESFEELAREKQISLTVNLPKTPLPFCLCDKDRIGQVIAVLLHNAICYTPAAGCIQLSLKHSKRGFIITVADNGPGISDGEKAQVFDRFYRTEKSRSTKGHYGLGLCIASEIVKSHQGCIKISDTVGGGATFTVSLP